jgi:hypothetical protein
MKILVIEVPNNSASSVTLYSNQKILPSYYGNPDEKITVKVPYFDSAMQYRHVFFYGQGGWSDEAVKQLTENIDSISIRGNKGNTLIRTKPEIQAYLEKHRSGFAKHVLTIEAK